MGRLYKLKKKDGKEETKEKKEKISQPSNIFVHKLFQKKQRIISVWISTVEHFQIA